MAPTALNRPLSDEEMDELERQSAGSAGPAAAPIPQPERPLTDAELDALEMRAGTGTVLQQTPFGQATDPAAPKPESTQRPLSDRELDDLQDETVRNPSYIPTFDAWDDWDRKRAARSNNVQQFLRGAGSIAQALGGVTYSVLATPGNFVFRGFGPAYDTLVHSSAEGMRRAGVGIAEMLTWAGDTVADIRTATEREAALDNQLRKQMASSNAFTGSEQVDAQIFAQAKEKARSEGFYYLTQEQKSSDRREQYDRFVRGRALEQEFLGIGNYAMGNEAIPTGNLFGPKFVGGEPIQVQGEAMTKRMYGVDDSKVDEGIATGVMLAGDPSGWLPLGVGALNKVKALRRLTVLADKPFGWTAGGLGKFARLAEDIEAKATSAGLTTDRLAKASGAVAIGAGVFGVSQNNDLAKGIAAAATVLPTLKYSGKILRRAEGAALAGQMVAKEMGVGGVGVLRADSASRLAANAAIPGRYRDAMRGFFSGPESSLKRASQNEALPLSARKTMARLDRAGATQAFRIADDAVSGALAGSVVGVPFAAIAPEDKQAEIFGSIATMGALGGAISGPLARRAQMADADVARMLADIEAVGGDAVTFAQLPHDKLVRLAAMQGVVSSKVDFVPLRADEYAANEVLNAKNATTTKGLYVDAEDGNRPRIFINIDQLAAGDVTGHEIGHAILKSDILGGEIKNNMRNLVNVQYGQDGVVARGREYATKLLADQVEQGVTGIKPEVLTDAEMAQVARGATPEDIVRARWQDKDMRERMINERIDEMNQRDMANGGMEWDWARDEIAAETFSGLSGGIDFRNIRQSGPMAAALGAFSGTLDMMGARFRGNGRLETPNRLFEENPLMDTPQMRKAVTDYTKAFDRYLAGMERDSAPKRRGTKIAPTGKASEAARSQHNRVYRNGNVEENDIFIVDANGNQIPKSQQQLDTQERARAATLGSINKRDRLVPMHSNEWGARKVGNRTEVGGPNLPLQFDHFVQIPEWLRLKAREFEAGRKNGQSYRISYNAIGTGVSGSYKIKNLGNVEAITREMVPFAWQLSEKNHLLAKAIDLDAFRAAAIRAVDRGELPDFGNNVKQVEADLKAMLKNYEDGLPGETGIGVLKRSILNGLLGTGTAVQKAANPLYAELNPKGSIRTFRFDRLNYADAYATGYFPHYHKINTNALPREAGIMSLDEWRQFDADRKATWLNNRAREAGYTNAENWRGADEAGFGAANLQYRNEFPVPAQGGAAALPGDATGGTRGQAMPDAAVTQDGLVQAPEDAPKFKLPRQAMADVGSAADEPPRRLIDMPQSALKVLHADSAELPKPSKKLTNATVALTLADVAERHNNGIITSSNITPEQKSDLMTLGADEAEAALKASGKNAGNWYSVAIEAALGIAGVIYRELSDVVAARSHAVLAKEADPVKAGQFALRLPLAITSQNMTVKLNTRASNEQFNIFLKTGKFDPSIAYGEKAKSISGNLDLANVMIDELGSVLALEDFVSRQFTVRELEAEASKIAGRSIKIAGRKDDIVNGAAIFGPKIGQGFLQNLMGKFDPVTIDLWMRRTWGRWTGDVVGDGVTAQRLARLIDQSRKAGRKLPDSIKRLRTTMRSMGETKTGKAKKPELTMSEDVEARLEAETAFRKEVEAFAKEVNAEFQGMYKMMSDVMSPALAKKVQEAIERAERLPDQADAILSDAYNAVIREQSRVKQQLDKKWSALPLEKKKEIAAKQSPEWANVEPKDRAQFIKKTKPVLKGDWLEMQHQAEGRTAKLENPQKNIIKPAWANAAKSIVSELNPIDIPSDMDRRVITEVVNGIREELERRGYTVTNADVQAILWYPEKDLWAKLRGEEESILKQSYDDEFINIAEGLGLGLEARKVAKQIRGY